MSSAIERHETPSSGVSGKRPQIIKPTSTEKITLEEDQRRLFRKIANDTSDVLLEKNPTHSDLMGIERRSIPFVKVSGKIIRKKPKPAEEILLREEKSRLFWRIASGRSDVLLRNKTLNIGRIEVGQMIRILCGKNRVLIRRVIRVQEYTKLYSDEAGRQVRNRMLGYEKTHRMQLKCQAEGLTSSRARSSSSGRLKSSENTPLVVIEFEKRSDDEAQ